MASLPADSVGDVGDNVSETQQEYKAMLVARQALRQDLQPLISAYRDDDPLPFSWEELVVMAIMNSDEQYLEPRDILQWTFENFTCYARLMVKIAVDHLYDPSDGQVEDSLYKIKGKIERIAEGRSNDGVEILTKGPRVAYSSICCTVTVDSARVCLRKWLEPERKGAFRFLDLPAELRNRVYDMTVTFPRSTVMFFGPSYRFRPGHLTIYHEQLEWETVTQFALPNKILSLAFACKQLAKEIFPIFYGCNKFRFGGSLGLVKFTKRVSAERMRHLKRIHLDLNAQKQFCEECPAENDEALQSAVDTVSNVAVLDELNLTIFEVYDKYCRECDNDLPSSPNPADNPFWLSVSRLAAKAKMVVIEYGDWPYNDAPDSVRAAREFVVKTANLRFTGMKKGRDFSRDDGSEVETAAIYKKDEQAEIDDRLRKVEQSAAVEDIEHQQVALLE